MQYRIQMSDDAARRTGILHLEFSDDRTAIQFVDKIARLASDSRIELWDGDRLVKLHPILRSVKGPQAAN